MTYEEMAMKLIAQHLPGDNTPEEIQMMANMLEHMDRETEELDD